MLIDSDKLQNMISEAEALADERGLIAAGPNTRTFLEEAANHGVVCRTGAMIERQVPGDTVQPPLGPMTVAGSLWDQYRLCRRL